MQGARRAGRRKSDMRSARETRRGRHTTIMLCRDSAAQSLLSWPRVQADRAHREMIRALPRPKNATSASRLIHLKPFPDRVLALQIILLRRRTLNEAFFSLYGLVRQDAAELEAGHRHTTSQSETSGANRRHTNRKPSRVTVVVDLRLFRR